VSVGSERGSVTIGIVAVIVVVLVCTMGVAESRLHFGFNRIQPSKEMSGRVGAPGECSGSSDLVACILGACDFAGERRSKSHMCQRC